MGHAASFPNSLNPISIMFRGFASTKPVSPEGRDDLDEMRSRRALIEELLSKNPEAFSSEYDFVTLFQHYPANF